jgi:hypothetical protein
MGTFSKSPLGHTYLEAIICFLGQKSLRKPKWGLGAWLKQQSTCLENPNEHC